MVWKFLIIKKLKRGGAFLGTRHIKQIQASTNYVSVEHRGATTSN
jgi:hypothetical protein